MTSPTASDLGARLRGLGLRVTRPRMAVLAALGELGGHRTADDVVDYLGQTGARLPRSSVYNVLDALARAGAVMALDSGPGAARYEDADQWHHHFVCRRCGRIADVPCAGGERPCLEPNVDVGVVEEAAVIYRGVCRRCGNSRLD